MGAKTRTGTARPFPALPPLTGVNLGNWLVLERWMQPSLFAGSAAPDRFALERDLPSEVLKARLAQHYETYVTADTFFWLRDAGVNLVRLPVPYWVFGSQHHTPVDTYVERALEWARATDIRVLIDLHTVPGSQNGFDNGGVCGLCCWHTDPARIEAALEVVRRLARRFGKHEALFGIEPLNEPANEFQWERTRRRYEGRYPERTSVSSACPLPVLARYYERCYAAVRAYSTASVALVLHDRFEPLRWRHFMPRGSWFENVWLDTHIYLGFADAVLPRPTLGGYRALALASGLRVAVAARSHPVLVGEWSLANHLGEGVERELACMQLGAWRYASGVCFWSLRNDAPARQTWSFADCVRQGWLRYL